METHSTILAWRIPMDIGARQATVHGGHKELDMTGVTGHAYTHARSHKGPFTCLEIIL